MNTARYHCPSCGVLSNSVRCPACGTDTQESDDREESPTREIAVPYGIFDHARHGHGAHIHSEKQTVIARPSLFVPHVSIETWTTPRGHSQRVRITRDELGFGKISQLGDL